MSEHPTPRAVFARLLQAFAPYLDEIVLVGGWVHALYLADANSGAMASGGGYPIQTDDIDFTLPHALLRGDRPTLLDLAMQAGFRESGWTFHEEEGGRPDLLYSLPSGVIDLDLLVSSETVSEAIAITGQDGLMAHGYPDLHLLLHNVVRLPVGTEIHPTLVPPLQIRVPTPAAYILQKGLASRRRINATKVAKDLVYIFEILRHPGLGAQARHGLRDLKDRYHAEYASWRDYVSSMHPLSPAILEAVEQIVEANRVIGSQREIAAQVIAQFQRAINEAESE
jgi:Nucleotidyltransferase